MRATNRRFELSLTTALFRALFGPIVWAAHFALLYAAHTALCVFGAGDAAPAASTALTVVALATLALTAQRMRNSATTHAADSFLDRLAATLIILSAAGVIWAGAAAAFIESCVQSRYAVIWPSSESLSVCKWIEAPPASLQGGAQTEQEKHPSNDKPSRKTS